MALLIGLPILLLVLATALLIAGLRGRRVDDHPLCRRCGFDLIGLPSGSTVCSECGAPLLAEGAIRTGHRVRRAGIVALALTLLLPSVLWLGFAAYVSSSNVQWIQYKPLWLLLREADTDPAAVPELLNRLAKRKLSATEITTVVAKALANQADRTKTWNAGWGEFVEQAHAAGVVPDTVWTRYLEQAPVLAMRARPTVARGDPIWVVVSLAELRLGWTTKADLYGVETSRRINEHDCGGAVTGGFTFLSSERGTAVGSLLRLDPQTYAKLPAGMQTLKVRYDVELSRFRSQSGTLLPLELEAKFNLTEPPPPTVSVERDPQAWFAIMRDAQVRGATYFPSGDLSLRLQMSAPVSFDLAFDVFARLPDGTEKRLTSYTASRGTTHASHCIGDVGWLAPDVKTFDLILRPSVEVALQTLNLTRLSAGDVRIENIPLRRAGQLDPRQSEEQKVVGTGS